MKKILTTLIIISAATYSFGQSLRLYNGGIDITNDTLIVNITSNALFENDIDIHNITSSAVTYHIRRTVLNPPLGNGCDVYFCAGASCYAPSTNTVYDEPGVGTTLAGMTNLIGAQGLVAHFDVGQSCCDTYVKYQTYFAQDTATVTVHYSCSNGINDIAKASGVISTAYPNPSNSTVSIKYILNEFAQNGKITFYDMLGKTVKEVELIDKQGTAKINVTDLNSGIYFYSFLIDGKTISTRKLVISSK